MADLRNAVLATLVYYDIFDFPLTSMEIHRYLINPARFDRNGAVGEISLYDVVQMLDELSQEKKIGNKYGYYMVTPERAGIYETRIDREKISSQKWKWLVRMAFWLQSVPYLRALFASGSMALSNTTLESDFDVLVVVRHGRLYTCRILLSFIASLLGARRTRHDRIAPNKFCFNHYLTDRQLKIPYESLYNAQMYAHLIPVFDHAAVGDAFYRENIWLNRYVYNFKPHLETIRHSVALSPLLQSFARLGEILLNSVLGDVLEQMLRWYQQRRISRNPITYAAGGRTIFTDFQLEFHPHSAERIILEKYNTTVRELGTFWNYVEIDSGLQ